MLAVSVLTKINVDAMNHHIFHQNQQILKRTPNLSEACQDILEGAYREWGGTPTTQPMMVIKGLAVDHRKI